MDEELKYIAERIADPEFIRYELHAEVITWALRAMKADNTLSVAQAFEEGCREWDL